MLSAQIFDEGYNPIAARIEIPIHHNSYISATSIAQLRITPTTPAQTANLVPLRFYDPGFKNTTVYNTKISYLDPNGSLYYRGYNINELIEKSNYLEVSYLLINGHLPNQKQYDNWVHQIMHHTYLHSELEEQMKQFRYDAHPMGMMLATIASLSTFHPDANPALRGVDMYLPVKCAAMEPTESEKENIKITENVRNRAIYRMIGKASTIASNTYRHRIGRPYNFPMPGCLNYAENILYQMDKLNEPDYKPDSRLVRILDKIFILQAESGSSCSTVMMRHLTSSGVDPYTALSGAGAALFGERKSPAVICMINEIKCIENIKEFLDNVKTKTLFKNSKSKKPPKLQGFGHRIYKNNDPRVKICKGLAFEVFELLGKDTTCEIAVELEAEALKDSWFSSRNLYPNVDFWVAIVFHTLGFPQDMFPVWTLLPRISGLISHWKESLDDPEYKIYRPRQIYTGYELRKYELLRSSDTGKLNTASEYLKSDPQAAFRRTTGDPRSLGDIIALISKTESEIAKVRNNLEKKNEEKTPGELNNTNIQSGLKWMSGFGLSKSVAALNNELEKLQNELESLKQKQDKILGGPSRSRSNSPTPDLTAGSHALRVILKK